MNKNDKNKIKQMYSQINTPEYHVKSSVLNEISTTKRTLSMKKKVLITAMLLLVLLLAGTAAVASINKNLVFKLPDNAQQGEAEPIDTPQPTPVPDPEDIVIVDDTNKEYLANKFMLEAKPDEYRATLYYDEEMATGSFSGQIRPVETQDYAVMEEYLMNANIDMPLPSYIPSGYEFTRGSIGMYVDESMLNIEPQSTWEENGMLYYIYQLQDGYEKNISHYSMSFEDSDKNKISIYVNLEPKMSNSREFGASDTATAEYVDIDEYSEALLIYDVNKAYGYNYLLAMYKDIEPAKELHFHAKLYDDYMHPNQPEQNYTELLTEVNIMIRCDDLAKKEILKIAKNLK